MTCREAWFIGSPIQHCLSGVANNSGNTLWPHERSALYTQSFNIRDVTIFSLRSLLRSTFRRYKNTVESTTTGLITHQVLSVFTPSKSTLFSFAIQYPRQPLVGTAFFCPCVEPSNDATETCVPSTSLCLRCSAALP